jgi:hypothetical protein
MKLILLESSYRSWLNSRNALVLDANLDERFVGLTHAESVVYAGMSNPPYISFDHWNVPAITQFLDLYERHEQAIAFRFAASNFRNAR